MDSLVVSRNSRNAYHPTAWPPHVARLLGAGMEVGSAVQRLFYSINSCFSLQLWVYTMGKTELERLKM